VAFYTIKIFSKNRALVARSEFTASDERDALDTMRYIYQGRPCELWCGSRKVANWGGTEQEVDSKAAMSAGRRVAPASVVA
jgi:hypothetical protein